MKYQYNKDNWSGEFNTLEVGINTVNIHNMDDDNSFFSFIEKDDTVEYTNNFSKEKIIVYNNKNEWVCAEMGCIRESSIHPAIALAQVLHNIY